MPFSSPPTKAQNDPLGPATLAQHSQNLSFLRWLAAKEHIISSGEHNAWEVARVVARITPGGPPTINPSTSDITSVTNPSAGTFVINLASSRFTTDMRVQINVCTDGTKPWVKQFKVVSATQIEVYLYKLTPSALGVAGNAWALTSNEFEIAIHSAPLSVGSWNAMPDGWARGDYFDDAATGWNTLVQESAELQRVLTAYHSTAGAHVAHSIAKYWGTVGYSSGSYGLLEGTLSSIGATSTGDIVVNHGSLGATTTHYFAQPDYLRLAESLGTGSTGDSAYEYLIDVKHNSATQCRAYAFRWNSGSGWWERADTDFMLAVYGD